MNTDDRVDVVVLGDVNPDLILSGGGVVPRFGQAETLVDRGDLTLGGSAAIVAAGLARLGVRVALIGVVGDDALGRMVTNALEEVGVVTTGLIKRSDISTGFSVHLVQGDDRAILTHLGSIAALQNADIDRSLIARAKHLHLAGVFLLEGVRADLAGVMAEARASGVRVSLDTNWDPNEAWEVADLLEHTDVLLPNEGELLALSGESTIEAALETLGRSVDIIVVKEGADGARMQVDGQIQQVPAPPTEVVDAIGAGDSFDAGFVASLTRGDSLDDALRLAIACGSLSVRTAGGTAAQATWAEAVEERERAE